MGRPRIDPEVKKERWNAYMRGYREKNAKKIAKWRKEWLKTRDYYETKRTHRDNHPDRYKCYLAVFFAIQTGKMKRGEECEQCGSEEHLQAHHQDYSKPLEVQWLCRRCHYEVHDWEKNRPENRRET